MIKINLLPWREQQRLFKKKRFGVFVAIVILLAFLCVFILHMHFNGVLKLQDTRQQYLNTVLGEEQFKLGSLNKKLQGLESVVSDLNFLLNLKASSYQAVDALDKLVRIVPEGVSFTKLTRTGNNLMIMGMAKTDLQIPLLMENLDKSQNFKQPVLTEISGKDKETSGNTRYFILKVELESTKLRN